MLIKTLASRAAMRISFAYSYLALERFGGERANGAGVKGFDGNAPTTTDDPSHVAEYLKFSD